MTRSESLRSYRPAEGYTNKPPFCVMSYGSISDSCSSRDAWGYLCVGLFVKAFGDPRVIPEDWTGSGEYPLRVIQPINLPLFWVC